MQPTFKSVLTANAELYRFSWIVCNCVVRTVVRCLPYPAVALTSPFGNCFFVMTKFYFLREPSCCMTELRCSAYPAVVLCGNENFVMTKN